LFLLLQPFGQVPVLEDGDLTLFGEYTNSACRRLISALISSEFLNP